MSRFTKKAQSAISNSFVTVGREKIAVEELIKISPEITITAFDSMKKGDDKFYAVAFKEDPSKFFFSGSVLTQVLDSVMEGETGTCEEISKEVEAEGGIHIKMYTAKSKNNRDYIAVDIIE